ncbi:sigma factor, partial [Angustibacter peucedani]
MTDVGPDVGSDVGSDLALERVVRSEAGRLVGVLHRLLGDLDVAEEAVADAVVEALQTWRRTGIPDTPAAWLHTAARRNALDRLRRESRLREGLPALGDWAAGARAALVDP